MRIAFVTFEYPPFIIGGAGIYALNVTRELAKLGHHLVIFVPGIPEIKYDTDMENIEFRIVKINKKLPFKALHYWLNLPAEIRKEEFHKKFDIIHFNGISYWFLKKKISKAPHVVTIHHLVKDAIKNNKTSMVSRIKNIRGETSFFIPFIEKRCIRSAEKVIAVSNFTKSQILSTYDIDSNNIFTIHNGIDLTGYNFTIEEMKETRKQLNLNGKPLILFVGRINDPRKGLKYLLSSFKKVVENFDAKLVIVGKGDQAELKDFSKSLGISENIYFTGFVDDINLKKYYSLCDIYVCSSKLEGFGLTILEAMAAGKPIVATKVGAISELLINGVNGILVESEDIASMSNAIINLLQNEDLAINIGNMNAKYVTSNFNWTNNAKKVEEVYTICQQYPS